MAHAAHRHSAVEANRALNLNTDCTARGSYSNQVQLYCVARAYGRWPMADDRNAYRIGLYGDIYISDLDSSFCPVASSGVIFKILVA